MQNCRVIFILCAVAFLLKLYSCDTPDAPSSTQRAEEILCPPLPSSPDSLFLVYKDTTLPDTFRLHALHNLSRKLIYTKTDSAIVLARILEKESAILGEDKWTGNAAILLGVAFKNKEQYDSAIDIYMRGIPHLQKADHRTGLAAIYTNLGSVYQRVGDYGRALEYHQSSLEVYQAMGNKGGESTTLTNMGLIYFYMRDFDQSLKYQERALIAARESGDSSEVALALANTGIVFEQTKELPKALEVQKRALAIRKTGGAPAKEIAINLANIGVVFQGMQQYDSAMLYLNTGIDIYDSIGYAYGKANIMGSMAEIFLSKGEMNRALSLSDSVLQTGEKLKSPMLLKEGLNLKSSVLEKMGRSSEALDYYHRFIAFRDSVNSVEIEKDLARKEIRYEYEKKMAEDSVRQREEVKVKDAEIIAQNAQLRQDRVQKMALFGGLALVIGFAVFAWNRFRVTRRQKVLIEEQKKAVEHQKAIVEEKQSEIVDSISYAKRLQEAILPREKTVTAAFNDSFILYRPKDIVAGDFYWFEKTDSHVLIAVADCTGHGVPGALVSVVCSNALNRAVNEYYLSDPGSILDKARELVIETFIKSDGNVMDGMDISLLAICTADNTIRWAGANNPIWLARGAGIEEIKGDKQPVGQYDHITPFTTHVVNINSGEMVYLFSDGFADQFGGERGKKFKYSQLKEVLLAGSSNECKRQKANLIAVFDEWKRDLEQVDDVCIIGIRF